jgi:hypothetical protein
VARAEMITCIHYQFHSKITSEGVLVQCVHCGWTANSKYWGKQIAQGIEVEMLIAFHDYKERIGMGKTAAIAIAIGQENQYKPPPY